MSVLNLTSFLISFSFRDDMTWDVSLGWNGNLSRYHISGVLLLIVFEKPDLDRCDMVCSVDGSE